MNVFTKSHTDASESDNSCSDSLVYMFVQKIPILRKHSFTFISFSNRTGVSCNAGYLVHLKEGFEDTKEVIRIRKSKTTHCTNLTISKYTVYLCMYRFTNIIFYEHCYILYGVSNGKQC